MPRQELSEAPSFVLIRSDGTQSAPYIFTAIAVQQLLSLLNTMLAGLDIDHFEPGDLVMVVHGARVRGITGCKIRLSVEVENADSQTAIHPQTE